MIFPRPGLSLVALVLGLASAPSPGMATPPDLSGAYDGDVVVDGDVLGHATAALTAEKRKLRGSVEITPAGAASGVGFEVHGHRRGRRVVLRGRAPDGARLTWRGRLMADGMLTGRAKVKGGGIRYAGSLDFVRAGFCEDEFATRVFAGVLVPICAQCHVEGGLAAATRLRVTPTDVAATRASVAGLVDFADPPASLILHKPLGELGHGGGVQLAADGPEIEILRQWVGLVADGTCGVDPGAGDATGEELWTANCASCHGADARGLDGRPNVRCNRAIHDVVRNGRVGTIGEMPAFPNLDDDAIAKIQDYLIGLCGESPTGDDLFAGNCATCHGADGSGTATAPDVQCTVPSRVVDAIRRGRGTSAMPAFDATALTDADLTLIIDALASRCDGTPAALFASNCVTCHGDTAGGGVNADGVRGPNIRCQEAPDFLEKVQGGGDGMPAFPELDVPTIEALANFVNATFCALGG
jgi:mono/diheme cytochrome c family protein